VPVLVALAGAVAVVGMAVDSSPWRLAAEQPSRPAVPAQAARARPLVAGVATALRRVAGRRTRRGGRAYYRRTVRRHVSAKAVAAFLPLYRKAERRFGVNWRLIASVHRQETAFSTEPSTYHGLNAFGCCAGPMQFNVTNGPPSTWKSYRHAFRDGRRPKRYPHRTRSHPSVYDDFDAIMAASSLLSDSGAGPWLGAGAWSAAYGYYGHDLFGVTYASQVLARAEAWQRAGFCANCDLDYGLVAELDAAYGAPVRQQLIAAERRRKQQRRGRDPWRAARRARDRILKRGDSGSDSRPRPPAGARRPSKPPPAKPPASIPPPSKPPRPTKPSPPRPRRRRTGPTKPSPTPSPTPPPTTTVPPPAGKCDAVRKVLGC